MVVEEYQKVAPVIRLAHLPNTAGDSALIRKKKDRVKDILDKPALLVSFVYLKEFLKLRKKYEFRDWVLDSGAFSAFNIGIEIRLKDYIYVCKKLMAVDPNLAEIFGLDVIGDWKAGIKNVEKMWKEGIPAIPTYHYGEPQDVLKGIARDYPKIAIGGAVGLMGQNKIYYAEQVFARVWPKKVHGFGFGSEDQILKIPFHSTDATNWTTGPAKFGRWRAFNADISVRSHNLNLRIEMEWYLKLERRARQRWKKEMVILEKLEPTKALTGG